MSVKNSQRNSMPMKRVSAYTRIEDYEAALKEWEETKPPGSASSADPFGHYKKKFEERESSRQSEVDTQSVRASSGQVEEDQDAEDEHEAHDGSEKGEDEADEEEVEERSEAEEEEDEEEDEEEE
uniref:HMG box domain-containing protein n=1 Tax=Heterorhabditis bacteriophora TaxID=37862 RepID=A0A1I7X424_HETBA